jgi:hypothetical protein
MPSHWFYVRRLMYQRLVLDNGTIYSDSHDGGS